MDYIVTIFRNNKNHYIRLWSIKFDYYIKTIFSNFIELESIIQNYNPLIFKRPHHFILFYLGFVLCAFQLVIQQISLLHFVLFFSVGYWTKRNCNFVLLAREGLRGLVRGGGDPFFQGFDPLPIQSVPILNQLEISIQEGAYNLSKGALLSGRARQKTATFFWSKFSKKCLKKLVLVFFSKYCRRRRKFD